VEQVRRVRDDPRLRRGLEAGGEQLLEVDVGLIGLHHRQRDLHPPVLPRDGTVVLSDHGHAAALPALQPPRQGGQVVPGLPHGIDHHHTRRDFPRLGRDGLGDPDARLERLHLSVEALESLLVAARRRREVREQLGLCVLADLRECGVVGREGRETLHEQERERREPLGRLLASGAIEYFRIGVQPVVHEAGRLHSGGEAVRVGIRHEDGVLGGELAYLDEFGAGGVGTPVADAGIAPAELPDPRRGGRDLQLPRVPRVGAVVVVADDHLDAPRDQGLDGLYEVGGCGRVEEHDPLRSLRDGSENRLGVGGVEEFGEEAWDGFHDVFEHGRSFDRIGYRSSG